jgi:integrase
MPLIIYRRGKIWHYRGTVAGRRLRGSTGTARKEVAQRIAADLETRQWKGHLDGPAAVLTFAQAAMLYRQAGKQDRYLRTVEDYWKDALVRTITPGAIRQSAITLCPMAGPATRNRQIIVPTQAIINHAASLGKCERIRVERFPITRKAKEPATWEWVRAFMAHAEPALGALACFMFLTGARVSQALAVTWKDVNLKAGKVLIRASGKGDDDRVAHMPPELVAALANVGRERGGPVFPFAKRDSAKRQWANAIERAGIEHLSFHACRHGFATGLLDKGVNPITVAARGGWKDARHVFNTYGHDVATADVTDILTGSPVTQTKGKRHAIK